MYESGCAGDLRSRHGLPICSVWRWCRRHLRDNWLNNLFVQGMTMDMSNLKPHIEEGPPLVDPEKHAAYMAVPFEERWKNVQKIVQQLNDIEEAPKRRMEEMKKELKESVETNKELEKMYEEFRVIASDVSMKILLGGLSAVSNRLSRHAEAILLLMEAMEEKKV